MNSKIKTILFFALVVALTFGPFLAKAELEITVGEIIMPLDGVNVTAGYGTFKNAGKKSIKVEFVSAEKFKSGEFHETTITDGVSEMHHMSALNIEAGKTLRFERGGSHMMLYDPEAKLKAGDAVKVTLKVNGKKTPFVFKIIERKK